MKKSYINSLLKSFDKRLQNSKNLTYFYIFIPSKLLYNVLNDDDGDDDVVTTNKTSLTQIKQIFKKICFAK